MAVTDRNLPCGNDPMDTWDHAAADRLSPHEQTCQYCQTVVEEYRVLAEPTREWRAAPIEVPAALLERVMRTVRSGLGPRTYLPLASPHGPARLDTATAAGVLRWVVDQVDGARARSCRIEALEGDDGPVPVVAIRLTVAVRTGSAVHLVAEEVRQLVRTVSVDLLGLDVRSVDVHVADLFTPGAEPDRS